MAWETGSIAKEGKKWIQDWCLSLVWIDLLKSSRQNMNLFSLDSGYRPIRWRLPHESEESCSASQTLTVSKLVMRFDSLRRGTLALATLYSQRRKTLPKFVTHSVFFTLQSKGRWGSHTYKSWYFNYIAYGDLLFDFNQSALVGESVVSENPGNPFKI